MATYSSNIVNAMEKGHADTTQLPESPTLTCRSTSWISYLKRSITTVSSTVEDKSSVLSSPLQSLWRPSKDEKLGSKGKAVRGPVIVQKLAECPKGYPRLAAFQSSDENFMIYRKFGYLQARLLLEKQDELRLLEDELKDLDDELHANDELWTRTRKFIHNKEMRARRSDLMHRIELAYCSYSNTLVAAGQVAALNRPGTSGYRSMDSFMIDETLVQAESTWIQHKEDLITLRPGREHAWLDASVEHLLHWFHCRFIEWIFCSSETKQKTEGRKDAKEIYYTRSRIERLVNTIILFIILALLIVPIYLLYHFVTALGTNRTDAACMCILLVATLAFSAVLSIFTRARRHEILASAAAYCAVLVVFLGNVPQMKDSRQ